MYDVLVAWGKKRSSCICARVAPGQMRSITFAGVLFSLEGKTDNVFQ